MKTNKTSSVIVLKKRKLNDKTIESHIFPPIKRRKLYYDENQRELIRNIECLFEVNDESQIDWALNALCSISTNNPNFSLKLINNKVLDDLMKMIHKYFDDCKDKNGDELYKMELFVTKEKILCEKFENRAVIAFLILRNLACNINNLFYMLENDNFLEFVLNVLKFYKDKETRLKNIFVKYALDILLNLSNEIILNDMKCGELLFDCIQFYLVEYEDELNEKTFQLLQTLNNLFCKNEEFFQSFLKEETLLFLIDLLAYDIGKFKFDLLCRTYSLELFYKIVVTSTVISKQFKKKISKMNGFIKRLIELIKQKSQSDDINIYDNYFANANRETKFPSDVFQLKCCLILKYFTKHNKKYVSNLFDELKVCISIVEDHDVVTMLMEFVKKLM